METESKDKLWYPDKKKFTSFEEYDLENMMNMDIENLEKNKPGQFIAQWIYNFYSIILYKLDLQGNVESIDARKIKVNKKLWMNIARKMQNKAKAKLDFSGVDITSNQSNLMWMNQGPEHDSELDYRRIMVLPDAFKLKQKHQEV